ncbi:DUF2461 family protein [Spirosoma spitsbergense]|uniref:DUF2461 family protein n=1 Tax=Spirosoma spitsbergense TaxID=431554 RepID=UPI000A020B2E|nr:DUF2461 family protein [Spirosoma spitsbergense]
MLHPDTLRFLADLKGNNNKPWFDEHRSNYEIFKADFLRFVIATLNRFEQLGLSSGNRRQYNSCRTLLHRAMSSMASVYQTI